MSNNGDSEKYPQGPKHPAPATSLHGNGDLPHWITQCQQGKSGPRQNLHNTLIALRHDPAWVDKFAFDLMRQCVVQVGAPVQDSDVEQVHEWLQANGLETVALNVVHEAVSIVGREKPFHPLRLWLNSLIVDDRHLLDAWLVTHLGCDDTPYIRAIGRMFLVAMVARVFKPGCKADYMPVLEGPQKLGKSTVCQILAGSYFSDSLPDLASDPIRVSMHLRGKWLIEISELSSFSKADAAHLKAFITSTTEQFTPKFARNEVREHRQCLFVGTTNDDAYLKDETGGRRFWPIKCGQIDLHALRRDRAQLLAEARDAFRAGEQWWPDSDFERQHIEPIQASRFAADAWSDLVAAALVGRSQITLMELALDVLNIPKERLGTTEQRRITAILRSLGWDRSRSTGGSFVWKRSWTQ